MNNYGLNKLVVSKKGEVILNGMKVPGVKGFSVEEVVDPNDHTIGLTTATLTIYCESVEVSRSIREDLADDAQTRIEGV